MSRFGQPAASPRVLSLGDPHIDAFLPRGGLSLGAVHEVSATGLEQELGAVAGAFVAALLSRLPDPGSILWVASVCDLYAPGLASFGLDPGRVVMVLARNDADVLGTMELALREGGLSAVVGEVAALGRLAGRRLHFACGQRGCTAFVLRRAPYGAGAVRTQRDATAVATRWRVAAVPSGMGGRELSAPCWQVELLHARGGREGSWLVEMSDAPGAFRVVSELGNGTTAEPRLRKA